MPISGLPEDMPCDECGRSVRVKDLDYHVCDPVRRDNYQLVRQMLELDPEIKRFDEELSTWLDSPKGRFAQYLAKQGR